MAKAKTEERKTCGDRLNQAGAHVLSFQKKLICMSCVVVWILTLNIK